MSVKTLRKQLFAAIAMVLVAAIALGSSTYAWFVSNNQVTATTASISAQSNAPFLVISNDEITSNSEDTAVTTGVSNAKLFPVQMVEANEAATTFKWESAYAATSTESTEKASTRFVVQSTDLEKYFVKQTFHVGTNGKTQGQFKNLRVSNVAVEQTSVGDPVTEGELKDALRVMVVCDAEVAIYNQSGSLVTTYDKSTTTTPSDTVIAGLTPETSRNANGVSTSAAYLTAADTPFPATSGQIGDKKVDVYLYYDGAVANIRTNNIDKLGSVKATVTFTADDYAAPTTTGA